MSLLRLGVLAHFFLFCFFHFRIRPRISIVLAIIGFFHFGPLLSSLVLRRALTLGPMIFLGFSCGFSSALSRCFHKDTAPFCTIDSPSNSSSDLPRNGTRTKVIFPLDDS